MLVKRNASDYRCDERERERERESERERAIMISDNRCQCQLVVSWLAARGAPSQCKLLSDFATR